MADKVKTISQLKLVAGFVDGDDRTLALDNPRGGLSKADITALNEGALACIVGDKDGAAFKEWKSAKVFNQTTTYLDLTVD